MCNISTPASPKMEISVSINVQERNVCLRVSLKNSLNIQKPVSFTCEPNTLPAPTARTINSGGIPLVAIRGATIPAAVNPATVADPSVTRKNAVSNQAKIIGGICSLPLKEAI